MGSNPTLSVCFWCQGARVLHDPLDETEYADVETGECYDIPDTQYRTASEADLGIRIDQYAAAQFVGVSRAEAQRLIDMSALLPGGLHVNSTRVKPNYRLRVGDLVSLVRPAPASIASKASPEAIPLDIVFEDSHLLVINKARGMVVHPAPGSETGTLVNAVLAHVKDLSGIGGELRPGIVHRLDKDTGGLLVVAKSDVAHRSLQAQIQARTAERKYMALVWGVPAFKNATVEAAIGRHPADRKKMAVITDTAHTSRPAVTELTLVSSYFGQFSLWEARLQTGRTHQIRVHCAYIHHPIVGDLLYGAGRKLAVGSKSVPALRQIQIEAAIARLGGQALHAYSLAFDHPISGEQMSFTVPLASPMQELLELLHT